MIIYIHKRNFLANHNTAKLIKLLHLPAIDFLTNCLSNMKPINHVNTMS